MILHAICYCIYILLELLYKFAYQYLRNELINVYYVRSHKILIHYVWVSLLMYLSKSEYIWTSPLRFLFKPECILESKNFTITLHTKALYILITAFASLILHASRLCNCIYVLLEILHKFVYQYLCNKLYNVYYAGLLIT